MFERFFTLRESPFPAGHQLRFLYPSREHQEARAHLRYGIENREPFVLITGEVGTGKTTALYDALAEWGNQVQVSLITNSALSRHELLEEICLRFGLDIQPGLSKPQTLMQLERFLHTVRARGDYAVLVLDEAHNLATDLLEEIRLLSNLESQGENLLQIFLVGQPELESKLSRPDMRQLRQRISVHYRLNPLSPEETAGYIHHRISVAGGNAWVIFPPDACREVYRMTHGIPREINTVASAAMLTAYTENSPTVRPQHARAMQSESEFTSVLTGQPLASDDVLGAPMTEPAATPEVPAAPPEPPRVVMPPAAPEPLRVVARPPAPEPPRVVPPPAPVPPPQPVAAQPIAPDPGTWQPRPLDLPASPAPAEPAHMERQEADAWSVAARELIEARRRTAVPPAPVTPAPVAHEPQPARRSLPPLAAMPPGAAPPARSAREESAPITFPSPAELSRRRGDPHARPEPNDLPPDVRAELEATYGRPRTLRHAQAPDEEWPPQRRIPWVWLGAGAALVAVVLVVWKLMGTGVIGGKVAPSPDVPGGASAMQPASPEGTPTLAVPTDTPPASVDSAITTRPASTRPSTIDRVPTATVTTTPRPVAPPEVKPAPPSVTTYGIAVGEFLNEERAYSERDRLGGATGLVTRILPYRDQGVTMYRLILGGYSTRDDAENAASDLFSKGLVPQASVMPLTR